MWVQVLGLTVLAWGNSIGDFSTNMAMARKGLANMALTACYAGPVFNLLVGFPLFYSVPVLCQTCMWDPCRGDAIKRLVSLDNVLHTVLVLPSLTG